MKEQDLMKAIGNSLSPDTSPSAVPEPGVEAMEIMEMSEPDTPVKLSDDEIVSILDNNITSAQNWVGSEIALEQARAMQYYLGEAVGDLAPPEVEDRSAIVDTVVSDQIEWLMPALMEIMYASGNPVKFNPRKPGDEDGADQMTHLVNYIVNDQNCGFEVMLAWFKTALLSKVGIIKAFWEYENERTQEKYNALTDEQFAIITDDPEVTVTSVTSYTDPNAERAAIQQYNQALQQFPQAQMQYQQMAAMPPPAAQPGQPAPQLPPPPQAPQPPDMSALPQLHNVVVTRSKKAGKCTIANINPEDFLIAQPSLKIGDGFCAHRILKTQSDLTADIKAGRYKLPKGIEIDRVSSDANAVSVDMSDLYLARHSLEDIFAQPEDAYNWNGDESQRSIFMYECYLPIDADMDGIAEWRKITKAGNIILENEVCDGPPFASLCPVMIPGLFYGRSIADLAMPIQRIKTGVLRAMIDNMNLQINGRTFAVEGQVNMEDLLTNRPGSIVRVKNAQAVGPLQQGMADMAGAQNLLQYVDTMSQERTGITKYSQGLDADTLNHTATGIENITQRADLRVKLLARTFAETGVKDLFRLIQKILSNYQDKRMTFQVNGKWVDVDPRVWRNQYAMSVTVGTGTGDMTRRVMQLMQVKQAQIQDMAIGLATPEQIYHTNVELIKTLQLGEPSQFFVDPATQPPKPPAPPPPDPIIEAAKIKAQTDAQNAQLQQQTDMAKIQAQAASDQHSAQLKAELEQQHQTLIDQRERGKDAQNMAWEREKFYADLAFKREQAALMAKVDSATEENMNDSIQADQIDDQHQAIQTELSLANQLLNS